MKRRNLLTLLAFVGGARLLPAGAQVNRGSKPFRIGLLPELSTEERDAFVGALLEFGWAEGSDFITISTGYQFDPDFDRAAKHMLSQNPDLVVTKATARALAVHRLTSTVPIVMFASGYPVEAGLAHSLARPGKNVTGNSIYAGTDVFGKLLELLRAAKPGVNRVGVFWGYVSPAFPQEEITPVYEVLRQSARTLRLKLHIVEVAGPEQVAAGLAAIDADQSEALLVTGSFGSIPTGGPRVMQFAVERRLPTISDSRWAANVSPAPLMVYGAPRAQLARQAARYVDRILKGAIPGQLPIEHPARFELVINLATAKAMRLTLPQSLVQRADLVVE